MSIDELAEAAGVDLSIYDQNLLSKLTYDGKLYGIPTFLQCIIGAYDKSVFEEKGLAVPTNYDEMVSAAAALKADGNGHCNACFADEWRIHSLEPDAVFCGRLSDEGRHARSRFRRMHRRK